MPEGSKDAAILIATSWQALGRAIQGNSATEICDCTVVTLFAGFFIEANLNYIIDKLGKKKQMIAFLDNKKFPGIQDKLGWYWYYNEYVARAKAKTRKELLSKRFLSKLRRRYPGFAALYRFRNDLAHGVINRTARSLPRVVRLRQQAKDIVDDLFAVAERAGHSIPRVITYQEAIR